MDLKVALILLLILVAIYLWWPSYKSNFSVPQSIREKAKPYLDQSNGKMTFSALKVHIPEMDNTIFPDVLEMWRNNDL